MSVVNIPGFHKLVYHGKNSCCFFRVDFIGKQMYHVVDFVLTI